MKKKNRKKKYFFIPILSFLTSCVSYEVTSQISTQKLSTQNNKQYIYNSHTQINKNNSKKSNQKQATKHKPIANSNKKMHKIPSTSSGISSTHIAKAKIIITEAEKYKGTPYKYGGLNNKGIDCSGLVYICFQKVDIKLPRQSIAISKEGKDIHLSQVKKGDLLFFATGNRSTINHIGIVHHVNNSSDIAFIHASTSKGVMISSIKESYWKGKFIKAKRIL